jgi:Na+-transporting NADH:ubiquinone oxidoreductase subunit NqrD
VSSIIRIVGVALGLASVLGLLTMGVALAQGGQLGGKLLTGSEITIASSETLDHDVYVFGGSVTSNGTINGDVVVAGGNVDLNGPVKGDVLAAGGRLSINGPVTGDVRVAGGDVTVAADIAEDLLATGGQVTLASGGKVGQDLIVYGGQLRLAGQVAGSATGSVGTYTKTGSVSGSDTIEVTGNQATFPAARSNPVLDAIRQFLAVLLVAVLALWLVPRFFRAAEAEVRERPLPSLGWGIGAIVGYFVVVIVIGIVVILLAILLGLLGFGSLLGIDLFGGFVVISAITLAFIVASAFLADAVVGLAVARLVAGRARQADTGSPPRLSDRERWTDLGLLAVGIAVVVALTSVPVLGGLVKLFVVLLGLGALWLALRRSRIAIVSSPPPEAAPPPA